MEWEANKDRNERIREMLSNGDSISNIAKILNINKSTVYYWAEKVGVKHSADVKSRIAANIEKLSRRNLKESKRARGKRFEFQKIGAAESDGRALHVAGCMLYWAEGAKERNSVRFANTDIGMMKLFIKFLRECFGTTNKDIRIRCRGHALIGPGLNKIESMWLSELGLPKSCLQPGSLEHRPPRSKNPDKYSSGICYLTVNNTKTTQRIFGAIGKYANIDSSRWL